MITTIFYLTAIALWSGLSMYFLLHFLLRTPRSLLSLAWSLAALQGVALGARQLGWLRAIPTDVCAIGGFGGAVLAAVLVATYESQRAR